MRKRINITVEENVLKEFDETLGLISRSAKINELMQNEVKASRNLHAVAIE